MHGEAAEPLQCVDCGKSAVQAPVSLHAGAVSAPTDEGHVRRTSVALCEACAEKRVAVQEPNFV